MARTNNTRWTLVSCAMRGSASSATESSTKMVAPPRSDERTESALDSPDGTTAEHLVDVGHRLLAARYETKTFFASCGVWVLEWALDVPLSRELVECE